MNRSDLNPSNPVVAILAGGGARRMGADKALLRLPDGRPAWLAVADTAREVATRVLLLVDTKEHAERLLDQVASPIPEVLLDDIPGAGPLGALAGALRAAPRSALLLVAADMPLVRAAVLRALFSALGGGGLGTGTRQVAAPMIGGVTQPMPACYDADLALEAAALLSEGRRDLRALLTSPRVTVHQLLEAELTGIDPDLRSFVGANTPDEWEAIRTRAAS